MTYMTVTQRREGFRAILAGDQCVTPAPVFDAISAQMAEDLGFEVAFMTGPTASAAVLGAPNHFLALLSATELAQQVRRICRACTIPVVAVAEHGYGNALNVMRTVEELESVGVSALTIDDPALPLVDGLEVLQRIKSDPRMRLIPVVVLTSSREERDVVESYQLGVNSYIVKPVDFDQFTEAVRQLGLYWVLLNQPPRSLR